MTTTAMPAPSAAIKARLAACVMDERTMRRPRREHEDWKERAGTRGSCSEASGMSYCGRPRGTKSRPRTPESMFESHNAWKG